MSKQRRGFTLIELLIVVIILGILAALVIPQFSDATGDSMQNSLITDLTLVRKQIAVYRLQHNGQVPALADFTTMMTTKTNPDGTSDANSKLGPYLDRIPTNPFTNHNDVGIGAVTSSSWFYDETTGEFRANCHPGHDQL